MSKFRVHIGGSKNYAKSDDVSSLKWTPSEGKRFSGSVVNRIGL
jgi:hypothetical protein